jgi:hypothetical protein
MLYDDDDVSFYNSSPFWGRVKHSLVGPAVNDDKGFLSKSFP